MSLISDLFLFSASLGAAIYCFVLSRRIRALSDLRSGLGGAIATLSREVEQLSGVLEQTRGAAETASAETNAQVARSEAAARQLQLLLASMHDLNLPAEKEG